MSLTPLSSLPQVAKKEEKPKVDHRQQEMIRLNDQLDVYTRKIEVEQRKVSELNAQVPRHPLCGAASQPGPRPPGKSEPTERRGERGGKTAWEGGGGQRGGRRISRRRRWGGDGWG